MQRYKEKSTIARFYRKDLEYNKINKVFFYLLKLDIWIMDYGRFPKNLSGKREERRELQIIIVIIQI